MISFFRLFFFLCCCPFVSLFTLPPSNRPDFFLKSSSDSNYELAKEYYNYKTKNDINLNLELDVTNQNDKYVTFAKSYEKNYRIFESNWFKINSINEKNNFKLKLNKFADQVDFRNDNYHSDLMNKPIKNIKILKEENNFFSKIINFYNGIFKNYPREIDWRKTSSLTKVKDQKNCGSCWAFSSTSALETFLRKNKLKINRLSEQELVDCSLENYGCNGGLMDKAFDYCIENNGLHTNENYPYSATDNECMNGCNTIEIKNCTINDKVEGSGNFSYLYTKPYSINSLKEALKKNPVSIAINANTPIFRFYSEGIIEDDLNINSEMNHAVLLVGYSHDKKGLYWIIQNSWGEDWGDKGFIKIRGREGEGILSCQIYGVYPINKTDDL